MRAVVVCRFPVYREALARLVGAAFGPDPAEGYATLQDALDQAAAPPLDMMVVELAGEDPEFRDLKAAAEAIKPAPPGAVLGAVAGRGADGL
ncbi:MAG: hypothetical protein WDN45_01115 [Caulobacteraceae bacterium]